MLPVAHRIRTAEDFRRVFRQGSNTRNALGIVTVCRAGHDVARLGVVVSRKIGGAVVRNTVKRRIRHAFARSLPQIAPVDIVIRCQGSVLELTSSRIEELLLDVAGVRSGSR